MGPIQAPAPTGTPALVEPGAPSTTTTPPRPAETSRPQRHLWLGLIPGMVALLIMLVFIFQNLRETTVSFLGFAGGAPLGLLLVAAALLGGVVVFGFGSVRIVQLRRRGRGRRP
ncbi:lipopolysaccharide assembly protein LapA domain-containing protein [Blastococcus litoris]|uniref:lipopolysaccharide assembly protein LapA domain-containing protein n=1 Tax=Blastococcus litoris TaxID=2171622 RepID=UPI0013E06224|nr:lipopolysaccharide assembly protein LapA domain-containing protein [Blastococcus litoris]